MEMEALAGGLGDKIWDAAMTQAEYDHDKSMQKRSAELNVQVANQANDHMARLQRQARINGAMDMVQGMRQAGLNPAIADGGSFASTSSGGASGVGAPSSPASRGSDMGRLALEASKYSNSERDLMAAQAQKLREEATSTRLKNENTAGANKVSETMLRSELEHIQSSSSPSSAQHVWSSALLKVGNLNQGALDAYVRVLDSVPMMSESIAREMAAKLAAKFDSLQFYATEGDTPDAKRYRELIASLPGEQARQIRETTDNIRANTLLLISEMGRTDKQVELIDKQKELIDKQMKELDTIIRSTHHSDLVSMWEDGEYMSFALGTALDLAPRLMPSVINTIAAGRFAKGVSRNGKSASKPTSETLHEQWRYNKNGQPTSYKKTRMSGLAE